MKINEIQKTIGHVFLDMDGVVAGVNQGMANYYNLPLKVIELAGYDSHYWQDIKKKADIEDFFANLPWEENAEKLMSWFTDRNIPFTFLTRPIKGKDMSACVAGKKKWLKRMGLGNIPVLFKFKKEEYALDASDNANILIDDHSGNIKLWNKAGGIGLLYVSSDIDNTLSKLEKLYENK